MVKIAPSILAADFSKLGKEIKAVDKAGADMIHLDIMDGHFVDNISFGPGLIASVRKSTNKVFDVHLMIDNVDKYVQDYIKAGADVITFHVENTKYPAKVIKMIKAQGIKVGLALSPDTSINKIGKYLEDIDQILVMSVNPGFSGQKYISQEEKVKEISQMIRCRCISIEVDGGINDKNAPNLIKAGADILVSGNYIFKSSNYKKSIQKLKG